MIYTTNYIKKIYEIITIGVLTENLNPAVSISHHDIPQDGINAIKNTRENQFTLVSDTLKYVAVKFAIGANAIHT